MPSASDQRLFDLFTAQFTPDGGGHIYRKWQKGAAIRISAAEYQGFVDTFRHDQRRLKWAMIAGVIVMMLILVGWAVVTHVDQHSAGATIILYGIIGALVAVFAWISTPTFTSPARTLERRAPAGGALSREAFRRRYYTAMSWKKLFGQLGAMAALCVLLVAKYDILHGWGRLWLALLTLLPVSAALAVWRKWRYTDPTP